MSPIDSNPCIFECVKGGKKREREKLMFYVECVFVFVSNGEVLFVFFLGILNCVRFLERIFK
jgi:hypothetical protein